MTPDLTPTLYLSLVAKAHRERRRYSVRGCGDVAVLAWARVTLLGEAKPRFQLAGVETGRTGYWKGAGLAVVGGAGDRSS